jgi:hypothetical protein
LDRKNARVRRYEPQRLATRIDDRFESLVEQSYAWAAKAREFPFCAIAWQVSKTQGSTDNRHSTPT